MTTSEAALPSWSDQMKALERVGEELVALWRPDGATEAERQDMDRIALSVLSGGYLCRAYTNSSRPEWMAYLNVAFNQLGPNPDYVYMTTEVDPKGVYRISGYRGTIRFVGIVQQAVDMITPDHLANAAGKTPASHDVDDLQIAEDGYFSVILSAERPADYDGDWWRLDPITIRLLMRRCSADWSREVDARIAIVRLDEDGSDMSPGEMSRRFSDLREWTVGMISYS